MLDQFFLFRFGDYRHAQAIGQDIEDDQGYDNEPKPVPSGQETAFFRLFY